MKIIFLNCWQGTKKPELLEYLGKKENDADIYCLQENTFDLKKELDRVFANYNQFTTLDEKWEGFVFGKSVYFKKDFVVDNKGRVEIYPSGEGESPGSFIYTEFSFGTKQLLVLNVHGKTFPGTKVDTQPRLKQSQIILDFVKKYKIPTIVGGDFNLNIDTKSVKMFEDHGLSNLIKDFYIEKTRNSLTWKEFENEPGFVKQLYADFVFVSRDIKVNSFKAPDGLVSDHNPMVLKFEL
jgi:endonuclease/exonuclease/phosphatase family metal-dependent hydrolase